MQKKRLPSTGQALITRLVKLCGDTWDVLWGLGYIGVGCLFGWMAFMLLKSVFSNWFLGR